MAKWQEERGSMRQGGVGNEQRAGRREGRRVEGGEGRREREGEREGGKGVGDRRRG